MKEIMLLSIALLLAGLSALSQNVGIGTTATPIAKLEIKGDGNNSATNNLILRNLAGDTMFRVRNDGRIGINYNGASYGRQVNIAGNGVNFYKTEAAFGGSIFPTDTSVVIWSDIADDRYVILQPSWGKVGIGTFSPQAMLHVNGPVIIGDNGTVIDRVLKASQSKNLGSIPAGTSSTQIFTILGANLTSTVYISPSLALPDGLLIAYARVSAANTVEVKFMNVTSGPIDPPLTVFHITVIE